MVVMVMVVMVMVVMVMVVMVMVVQVMIVVVWWCDGSDGSDGYGSDGGDEHSTQHIVHPISARNSSSFFCPFMVHTLNLWIVCRGEDTEQTQTDT